MTFVTAGRVGSEYKRCKYFMVMRIAVKLYEIKSGRDGISRFKYVGYVPETDTLDRYIRDKKTRLAKEYAEKNGAVFIAWLKHNDGVPPLYALAAAME